MADVASIPRYIPALNGLRAVSVFMVIITHSGFLPILGSYGVTVFFFVSGFLITNLLISESSETDNVNIPAFYLRRYLRLTPELYFYIAIGYVGSLLLGSVPGVINVLSGLFYFGNYTKIFEIGSVGTPFTLGPLWSLAVEEHFYLTFPLLFLALFRTPAKLALALIAVLVVCMIWRTIALDLISVDYTYRASDARFDSIAYGCLCAMAVRYRADIFNLSGVTRLAMFPLAALLTFVPIAYRLVSPDSLLLQTFDYTFQGLGLFALFLYLHGNEKGWLTRILEVKPLRFVGEVSYGMYLWHFSVINILTSLLGAARPEDLSPMAGLAVIAVTTPISIALGWASKTFVLKPFDSMRKRAGAVQVQPAGA